jgi:lipopolysaccharide/colanic/teichoic acid biosynthesis glycosyltransferase
MDSKGPGIWKSVFDRAAAALGILLTAPIMLICALAVWLDDGAPVFFRQVRVGRSGRVFRLVKFRSMRSGQPGTSITVSKDSRITRVGNFLRSYKLDELPQLWNVLRGEMSFVGPRPELPEFVDLASAEWRILLSVKPGITDLATLVYRNEERILFQQPDPQKYYREVVLPAKLALSIAFIRTSNFWLECKLIAYTVYYSVFPRRLDSGHLGRIFAGGLILSQPSTRARGPLRR